MGYCARRHSRVQNRLKGHTNFRVYKFGGLNVRSEFELSLADPVAAKHGFAIDVEIHLCALDELSLGEPVDISKSNDFFFYVSDNLAFRIQNGQSISIGCTTQTSNSDINLYLIGSAWGVLCHQRCLLPLHCSAVTNGGLAIAFCGPSGMGKSTLAAGLTQRGFAHLCDDVAMLELVGDQVQFTPVEKGLKLWRDATDTLQIPRGPRVGTEPDLDKYYVDMPDSQAKATYGLGVIYILSQSTNSEITITPLSGIEKFRIFLENIYRYEWATQIRDSQELISQVFQLLDHIEIYQFSRPKNMMKFAEGLDMLAAHMKSRGKN